VTKLRPKREDKKYCGIVKNSGDVSLAKRWSQKEAKPIVSLKKIQLK
jgi:hypothetical protein